MNIYFIDEFCGEEEKEDTKKIPKPKRREKK